jgi:hypothetical protein
MKWSIFPPNGVLERLTVNVPLEYLGMLGKDVTQMWHVTQGTMARSFMELKRQNPCLR